MKVIIIIKVTVSVKESLKLTIIINEMTGMTKEQKKLFWNAKTGGRELHLESSWSSVGQLPGALRLIGPSLRSPPYLKLLASSKQPCKILRHLD